MYGKRVLRAWSATQGVVALSSAEAELYAMIKGAAETLGMLSLANDFGDTLDGRVHSDAAAAIGIINRTGVGKLRHLRVQYLWLQDKVRIAELMVQKVPGVENPADLLTKHLAADTMNKHLRRLQCEVMESRASTAPTLHQVQENGWISRTGEGAADGDRQEEDDRWSQEGERVVRRHGRPRLELFTPRRVEGAPPCKSLTPIRVTVGKFASGEVFRLVDTWTARGQAHAALRMPWTGSTTFIRRSVGDEILQGAEYGDVFAKR